MVTNTDIKNAQKRRGFCQKKWKTVFRQNFENICNFRVIEMFVYCDNGSAHLQRDFFTFFLKAHGQRYVFHFLISQICDKPHCTLCLLTSTLFFSILSVGFFNF